MSDNKPDEVEIRFSRYALSLSKHWVSVGLVDASYAMRLISSAQEFIDNHLHCVKCDDVMPDEDFYRQKAQYANRQRAQLCKACWKEAYNMRIPK